MRKVLLTLVFIVTSISLFGQNTFNHPIYANGGMRVGENGALFDSVKISNDSIIGYLVNGSDTLEVFLGGSTETGAIPPNKISGLLYWFDASDQETINLSLLGDTVYSWADKSGRSNNLDTVTDASHAPLYNLSGEYIYFDATNSTVLQTDFLPSTLSAFEVFIVMEKPDTNKVEVIFSGINQDVHCQYVYNWSGADSSFVMYSPMLSLFGGENDEAIHVHDLYFSHSELSYTIDNGTPTTSSTSTTGDLDGIKLGCNYVDSYYSTVKIYEIVVYNRKLTSSERSGLVKYLSRQ